MPGKKGKQQPTAQSTPKKPPGRPKGSKNKPKAPHVAASAAAFEKDDPQDYYTQKLIPDEEIPEPAQRPKTKTSRRSTISSESTRSSEPKSIRSSAPTSAGLVEVGRTKSELSTPSESFLSAKAPSSRSVVQLSTPSEKLLSAKDPSSRSVVELSTPSEAFLSAKAPSSSRSVVEDKAGQKLTGGEREYQISEALDRLAPVPKGPINEGLKKQAFVYKDPVKGNTLYTPGDNYPSIYNDLRGNPGSKKSERSLLYPDTTWWYKNKRFAEKSLRNLLMPARQTREAQKLLKNTSEIAKIKRTF